MTDGRKRRIRHRSRRSKAGKSRTAVVNLLKLSQTPFKPLFNPLPPLEFASAEQIEQIHEATLHILEDIGLEFLDDEVLAIWHKAGAKVNHASNHVWIDRGLLLEALARAPSSFTWQARNPSRNLQMGGNALIFAPQAGMAFAANYDIGRQSGRLAHLEDFLKLNQMCHALHCTTTWLVEPQDIPASIRHLIRLPTAFTLTDKAIWSSGHGREISTDVMNMARIVFGPRFDQPDPVIGCVINANSPLRYDGRMLGGLVTYARQGQMLIITPFIMAGAMSPITIAAALAQQNAEALAGIALVQLINPGSPVVYGGFTTNIDMRSGAPAFGSPEGAWALIIGGQLARYYNLPYRGNGGLTTAQMPDAQAAMESMWNAWPSVLAHTNMIIHSAGWLDGGLTASYEKFIIDVEAAAMFHHFLDGFTVDGDTLALDMIAAKGPGGHHFGTPHTQARFRTEFYDPILHDRSNYESWRASGSQDAGQRAHNLWREMLAAYEPPPFAVDVEEALHAYTSRRIRELGDKNLYD